MIRTLQHLPNLPKDSHEYTAPQKSGFVADMSQLLPMRGMIRHRAQHFCPIHPISVGQFACKKTSLAQTTNPCIGRYVQ